MEAGAVPAQVVARRRGCRAPARLRTLVTVFAMAMATNSRGTRRATSRAKAPYLDYAHALASGWPIATGVIEGACRHIVKRQDGHPGARWGLDGAEAILKLRALHSNRDFDA